MRHRFRPPRILAAALLAASVLSVVSPAASAALPDTDDPSWELDRTIRTTPFAGSSVSMRDNEGSDYVPADDSLWLADDNAKAVYEIDPSSGALKRRIQRTAFNEATQLGGGPAAGTTRTNDFESIAYDAAHDVLYVFSGPCCDSSIQPAVFRLVRDGSGDFQVESYQPLAPTFDFTGAAWNPGDGKLYVGRTQQLRTYDYATNSAGSTFSVAGLAGITGMDFTANGSDLFVTTNGEHLMRVRWSTKSLVDTWSFDMRPFKVLDSRAVSLIDDRFYVSDGAGRTTSDPLRFAVFVFSVAGTGGPTAPAASFTATPASGVAPLTVSFTDTSTGSPTTWAWDFENDGTTDSTAQHPTHTYPSPGTFTAKLTVTNGGGSDSATRQIEVTSEPPPPSGNLVGNPGFETDTTGWGSNGSGTGVALEWFQPGRNGSAGAARMVNGATGNRKCVLNDVPNWVTTTTAGTYTASIWARGDVAGAQIKIKVFEMNGSTIVRSRAKTFTLSTSWTELGVSHTIVSPGSTLDLQVFVPRAHASPGTCFFADDASIVKA
ncbi:MAG TPA: PKD domain-containing protein [Actinomycetota bacterium]|nr:PKD domain-containing protein [Actinomycetota bacterium]